MAEYRIGVDEGEKEGDWSAMCVVKKKENGLMEVVKAYVTQDHEEFERLVEEAKEKYGVEVTF